MLTMAVGKEAAMSSENQGKMHQLYGAMSAVHDLDSFR
jgi:hypothetical protein